MSENQVSRTGERDRRLLPAIGLVTWFVASVPTFVRLVAQAGAPRLLTWVALDLAFAAGFWVATRMDLPRPFHVPALSALALALVALGGGPFDPILLVLVASMAASDLGPAGVTLLIAVQSGGLAASYWFRVGSTVPFAVFAYAVFQAFGAATIRIAKQEESARLELARVNAELRMASALLEVSARSAERLRIARELHDVLGHHLTALSLQLEVASHLALGEAKKPVEEAKQIAKLLLREVREVVSDLRDENPVDLEPVLRTLASSIARPVITLVIEGALLVRDPLVAQTAIRCVQEIVTNTVRHASARTLKFVLTQGGEAISIRAADDGIGTADIRPGNGLFGMKERVTALGGTIEMTSAPGKGFAIDISLPLGANP
jgi:signal transduction histidine kinase